MLARSDNTSLYVRISRISDKAQVAREGPSCAYNPPIWKQRFVNASSRQQVSSVELTARLVLAANLSLANLLFAQVTKTKQIA
jgi:hypothetical protein